MVDLVPAMIWVSDAQGRRTHFNRSWLDFTGRSLEQELGDGWTDGIHPEDRQRCLDAHQSPASSGPPFKIEYRLRRADGEFCWILSQEIPYLNQEGEIAGYVGSALDITAQKTADETRSRLAAIVENSDDAIVAKDLNGVITSWNAGAERIFEYREAEVLGKPITIIIPPELREEERDILHRLRRGQRIDHFETVRVTKSGRRVQVSLSISPVKDSSGRIVGASKIARDVTRFREVEEALRESEQRMRFCLEAAAVGTWDLQLDTGTLLWSENMEKVQGQLPGSFTGTLESSFDDVDPQDRSRVSEAIQSALAGDGKYHIQYRKTKGDGAVVWLEAIGQVIYDAAKRPVKMMGVCWDISERKRTEQALAQIHQELDARVKERTEELDRAQERLRLLSTRLMQMQDDERRRIARELHDTAGQLLVALNLTLVPVEEELLKTHHRAAGQITESLRLVEELSRDLRTMSHLLHPPLLDEAGLHSAVRWYVEGFAERSKIGVDLQLDPAVGRLQPELETATFRIVQESLTNIHRHSGSSSASISITRDARNLTVIIADHGKGLPTPLRAGVGIQGMKERVRQLGGNLEIESNGRGTRVIAIIPVSAASEHSAEVIGVSSRRSA